MFAALRSGSTPSALRSEREESQGHGAVAKRGVGRLLKADFLDGMSRGIEVSDTGMCACND